MKNDEITKDLLEFLLLTGGVSLALTNPAFLVPAIFIARYMDKGIDKKNLRRSVSYLKEKQYLQVTKNGKSFRISLSKLGKNRARIYSLQSTLLKKLKSEEKRRWDKKWRVVMFDIKSVQRKKRDALRRMLKRSGFEQLQKSAWVYPFECKQEIDFTKTFFKIQDDECRVVLATDIGEDKKFRKKFNII